MNPLSHSDIKSLQRKNLWPTAHDGIVQVPLQISIAHPRPQSSPVSLDASVLFRCSSMTFSFADHKKECLVAIWSSPVHFPSACASPKSPASSGLHIRS